MKEQEPTLRSYDSGDQRPRSVQELAAELIEAGGEPDSQLFQQSRELIQGMVDYKELRMIYSCAIKEVRTKLDVLNTEFSVRYQRNPIKFINTRLKSTASIGGKLARRGLGFSAENIRNHVHDMAGIRVICAYVDDIYLLADLLTRQDDVELVTRKDYIANPKPNGYRSLHLIVRVPVFFADRTREVAVEVQIRTIAMDFWASLEHQLKYKQQVENEAEIVAELKSCADVIAETDARMLEIRKRMEQEGGPAQADDLAARLSKLDAPLG